MLNMSKRLVKWAMTTLNINEEQLYLARKLENEDAQTNFALKVLGINLKDLGMIKKVKSNGGMIKYMLKMLGLTSVADVKKYLEWAGKSKLQKIMELCPNPEEIRDYFNQSYVHYRKMKKSLHTRWKFKNGNRAEGIQHPKVHLQDITNKISNMIVTDEMTLEDFYYISSKSFMACWCYLQRQKENIGKVANKVLEEAEIQMAA